MGGGQVQVHMNAYDTEKYNYNALNTFKKEWSALTQYLDKWHIHIFFIAVLFIHSQL